jgi:PKD repeat protein
MVRLSLIASAISAAVLLSGCLTAKFTATPSSAFTGESVEFDASGTSDGHPSVYRWDWDKDGTYDLSTQDAVAHHTFDKPSTSGVRLLVSESWFFWYDIDTGEEPLRVVGGKGPVANFTASPNPPVVGQRITFDASSSIDAAGTINKYEWDLDGKEGFEVSGSGPTTSKIFTSAGTKTIRLRISDNHGRQATTSLRLVVTVSKQPPKAFFTTKLGPAMGEVIFDGAGSSDAEGPIKKFQWDLDANGSFETDTGTNPVVSKIYNAGGNYNVSLRVTDTDGQTDTTTQPVTVFLKAPGDAAPTAAVQAKGSRVRFIPTSGGLVQSVRRGTRGAIVSGDTLFVPSQRSAGTARLTGLPHRLNLPEGIVWASSVKSRQDVDNGDTRSAGSMLLVFKRGGTSCLSIGFDAPPTGAPTGTFQVVGGTGRAGKLRGGGEFGINGASRSSFAAVGTGTLSSGSKLSIPAGSCKGLRGLTRRDLSHRRP